MTDHLTAISNCLVISLVSYRPIAVMASCPGDISVLEKNIAIKAKHTEMMNACKSMRRQAHLCPPLEVMNALVW